MNSNPIECQCVHEGQWKLFFYVPHTGKRAGAYGAAAKLWHHAKYLVKMYPDKFRIVGQ